ncbi:MAG: C-type lectin domain-containing protein, partial [Eubacteriales bacterium]|nr:C-type lectin domain-containing protein [Eubacteriales bacterium]
MERRKFQWIMWMLFAVIFAIEVTGTDICRVSAAGSAPADAKEWCGHFYKVFDEEVSVLKAKSKCEDMGGYLVTITSRDEQRFVDQLLEGEHDHFWVGLYRKEYKEKAVWMNGEENVLYQDIIHPHPLYGGGGYPYYYCIDRVGLNSLFFYYFSNNGSIKHKYVCEWGGRMDIANAKITLSQDKLEIINHYSEIAHKPDSITVEYTGLNESHVLEEGRDYDLEITNNTGIGEATVKITGKGRFTGSKITHFDIVPEKGKVHKTEVDLDRNIVFKWYKTNGEMNGYEIEYADNENFYQSAIVRLSGMRALSYQYTFLNVERSTTYYFRVRAYKTVNGKDYKGEWSDTHSQYSGNLLVASDFWGFGNDEYLIGKEYFEKFFGPETAREFSEKKGYNGSNGICTGMCIAGLASVYWDTPGVSSFGVQSLSEIKDPQKKSSAFDGKWSALDYCKFAHTIKQTVDAS